MICCNILYIIPSVTANDKGHGYAGICSIVRKYSLFSWFRSEMEATTVSRGYNEEIFQAHASSSFYSPLVLWAHTPCCLVGRGYTPSHVEDVIPLPMKSMLDVHLRYLMLNQDIQLLFPRKNPLLLMSRLPKPLAWGISSDF